MLRRRFLAQMVSWRPEVQDKGEHSHLAGVEDHLVRNNGKEAVRKVARSRFEDRHVDLAVVAERRLLYIELLFGVPKTDRGAGDSTTWR